MYSKKVLIKYNHLQHLQKPFVANFFYLITTAYRTPKLVKLLSKYNHYLL